MYISASHRYYETFFSVVTGSGEEKDSALIFSMRCPDFPVFCCYKHDWKLSRGLLNNIQWFHTMINSPPQSRPTPDMKVGSQTCNVNMISHERHDMWTHQWGFRDVKCQYFILATWLLKKSNGFLGLCCLINLLMEMLLSLRWRPGSETIVRYSVGCSETLVPHRSNCTALAIQLFSKWLLLFGNKRSLHICKWDLQVRKWCELGNYGRSGRKELDLCCVFVLDRPGLVKESTRVQC